MTWSWLFSCQLAKLIFRLILTDKRSDGNFAMILHVHTLLLKCGTHGECIRMIYK